MAGIKCLGAILILTSSLWLGKDVCAEKKRRAGLLRDLMECLDLLRGELELRAAPIPDLLLSLSEKNGGEIACFLRRVCSGMERIGEVSFSLIWRQAGESCLFYLQREEKEEIFRLGSVLGSLDLDAQLRALRYCCGFLQARLEEERRAYPVRRRLTLGLCACGAVLAIVMIL
ncbi:MAG: stage III sporulation protein AB [Oscillospiraceae bacterium]|nr:stage III sporulation protein AB [Oscillospiraceae bacterium]